MNLRVLILLLCAVLPGAFFAAFSTVTLFPDWAQLTASNRRYTQVANSASATPIALMVAEAAENRHRINCFAEGVGLLMGNVILAIGLHGICTLPRRS
jgi:hypothetical protein